MTYQGYKIERNQYGEYEISKEGYFHVCKDITAKQCKTMIDALYKYDVVAYGEKIVYDYYEEMKMLIAIYKYENKFFYQKAIGDEVVEFKKI